MSKVTNKERYEYALERSKGHCEVCYMAGSEMHHIVFGSSRRSCETKHSVILLCTECHRGTYGVHGREGRTLDLELKRGLQEKYKDMGKSEEEVRKLMGGRLYS